MWPSSWVSTTWWHVRCSSVLHGAAWRRILSEDASGPRGLCGWGENGIPGAILAGCQPLHGLPAVAAGLWPGARRRQRPLGYCLPANPTTAARGRRAPSRPPSVYGGRPLQRDLDVLRFLTLLRSGG